MSRRRTFGVYRHLLGADLRTAATPGMTVGREPHVNVPFTLGVGDTHHGPGRVAAGQPRDRVRYLCRRLLIRYHDEIEHAGAKGESPIIVGAQFAELALYLPDAHEIGRAHV